MPDPPRLPRCLFPGCPIRYRDGRDRSCQDHQDHDGDTATARLEAFTALAAKPGVPEVITVIDDRG